MFLCVLKLLPFFLTNGGPSFWGSPLSLQCTGCSILPLWGAGCMAGLQAGRREQAAQLNWTEYSTRTQLIVWELPSFRQHREQGLQMPVWPKGIWSYCQCCSSGSTTNGPAQTAKASLQDSFVQQNPNVFTWIFLAISPSPFPICAVLVHTAGRRPAQRQGVWADRRGGPEDRTHVSTGHNQIQQQPHS